MVDFDLDLRPWRGLEPVRVLTGGARNLVVLARHGNRQVVVRRSTRPSVALEWELHLLEHLAEQGLRVPRLVPTDDGHSTADGVVVQEYLRGSPPRTSRDLARVVDALEMVHDSTVGWPQRPGFASSSDLLERETGGDVRLDAMPPELVRQVRQAWGAVQVGPQSVVHGDVGAGNVLVDGGSVGFVDWDEARVDVRWFDLAAIEAPRPLPDGLSSQVLTAAGLAWETATCWVAEPDYARACADRLAALGRAAPSDPLAGA
jgi:Ser/Thr protein kinase RdoA (MazF antagonist)